MIALIVSVIGVLVLIPSAVVGVLAYRRKKNTSELEKLEEFIKKFWEIKFFDEGTGRSPIDRDKGRKLLDPGIISKKQLSAKKLIGITLPSREKNVQVQGWFLEAGVYLGANEPQLKRRLVIFINEYLFLSHVIGGMQSGLPIEEIVNKAAGVLTQKHAATMESLKRQGYNKTYLEQHYDHIVQERLIEELISKFGLCTDLSELSISSLMLYWEAEEGMQGLLDDSINILQNRKDKLVEKLR